MSAQEIIAYACIVGVCVAIGMLFRRNDTEPVPACERRSEDAAPWRFLPGVFRLAYPLLNALDHAGLGKDMMLPGSPKAQMLQRLIVTGALYPLTPQLVACAQIVYGVLAAGVAALTALGMGCGAQGICLSALFAGWMGWMLPSTTVQGSADRRRTELVRCLPFAIDLIGAGMRAGSNFGDSVRFYVTQGGGGALTDEFARLMKQVQLGLSLSAALEEMAQRVDSKEFTGFISSVIHSLETGAALVDTLNLQGSEMRRVRFNIAEQKAARAPSLMILPIAVFIMPSVFIMVFTPVYLRMQASGMGSMFNN